MPNAPGLIRLSDPVNRSHPNNRGKVAWWKVLPGLDGGRQFFDLIGQAHGALTNGPTWKPTARAGGLGAIAFDGTDDYVAVANSPAIDLTTAFTIAVSVRFNSV